MMKLIVTGHAQHGKGTVCEMLEQRGLKSVSSSLYCIQQGLFDEHCEQLGISREQFYEQRGKYRELMFNTIANYGHVNGLHVLAWNIFNDHDVYDGMRNREELIAVKNHSRVLGVAVKTVWVDASSRVAPEPNSSCTVTHTDCDFVVYNNGTVEELEREITCLSFVLGLQRLVNNQQESK